MSSTPIRIHFSAPYRRSALREALAIRSRRLSPLSAPIVTRVALGETVRSLGVFDVDGLAPAHALAPADADALLTYAAITEADEVAATWDAIDLVECEHDAADDDTGLIPLHHIYADDVADLDLVTLDY